MDIFAIFRGSPERQIQKLRKKVKEPHGDASVRQNAALKLLEMGTEPALRALLDRFTIAVSPSVQDEEEKKSVFQGLVAQKEVSVGPLISFLKNERAVYWPARVLREILRGDELSSRFNEILRFHWENPPATAHPKAELIRAINDLRSTELIETVSLFLDDEDDDVRLASVEFLLKQEEEQGRERILQCYVESENRPRVRLQILERLAEKDWTVRGFRPVVEETLSDGFALTRDGKVRRVGH